MFSCSRESKSLTSIIICSFVFFSFSYRLCLTNNCACLYWNLFSFEKLFFPLLYGNMKSGKFFILLHRRTHYMKCFEFFFFLLILKPECVKKEKLFFISRHRQWGGFERKLYDLEEKNCWRLFSVAQVREVIQADFHVL